MALPSFKLPTTPGGASGMEMMLKSLGLGDMVDAAKQFAESGAADKIIKFSEGLDELNERLARIELAIDRIEQRGGGEHGERSHVVLSCAGNPDDCARCDGAACYELRRPDVQSGPGSARGGNSDVRDVELPGGPAAGGSSGTGDARTSNGIGRSRHSRAAPSGGGEE